MTSLRLSIQVGETAHVYTDVEIGTGDVQTAASWQDGQVERADVSVTVASPTLGPWGDPAVIPPGRYRAELRDLSLDQVILDGTVARTGIRADDPAPATEAGGGGLRVWTVRLFDTATSGLREALAALPVAAATEHATAAGGRVVLPASIYDGDQPEVREVTAWSVQHLVEGCLVAAGAAGEDGAAPVCPPLGEIRFRHAGGAYDDGLGRAHIAYVGRVEPGANPTLLPISAAEWIDRATDLYGLVVEARYAAWPSEALVAVVRRRPSIAALVADPTDGMQALDALALDGYDIAVDPAETDDYVLAFANEVPSLFAPGSESPPTAAVLGSARPVRPDDEVETVPWRAPNHADVTVAPAAGYEVRHGRPYLDPSANEPYLLTLLGASLADPGRSRSLASVRVLPPVPPGQPAGVNPSWASALWAWQADEASDLVRVRIEVDADALAEAPVIGAAQYAVGGRAYATEEAETDADARACALTLVRPAAGVALQGAGVITGPPVIYAQVLERGYDQAEQAYRYDVYLSAGPSDGADHADTYEVETTTADPPVWPGDAATSPVAFEDIILAPATSSNPRRLHVRARGVYASVGVTTDWVYRSLP